MTNKSIAELLEGIPAISAGLGCEAYYMDDIERVFGPALTGYNEHIAALNALLVQQEREIVFAGKQKAELENVLLRKGFVRCDISACNCGSWHHRYGLPERMAELKDALAEAGFPLCNENGHLVSKALSQLIAEYVRLQEQNTNLSRAVAELRAELSKTGVWAQQVHDEYVSANEHNAALNALLVQKDIENANLSRAVAELTETKADFYRSGVADGRAQKDAELAGSSMNDTLISSAILACKAVREVHVMAGNNAAARGATNCIEAIGMLRPKKESGK